MRLPLRPPVRLPVRVPGAAPGAAPAVDPRGSRCGSPRLPVRLPGPAPGAAPGGRRCSSRCGRLPGSARPSPGAEPLPIPASPPARGRGFPPAPPLARGSMPRGRAWTQAEVSSLLALVGSSGEAALLMASTSRPNEALWREISQGLAAAGYGRSMAQCRSKWKALKQAFHSERETRRRVGHHSPCLPPHYRAMKSIWKAAGRPVFGERRMPGGCRGRVGELCGVAGRGVLGERGCCMATQGLLMISFFSSRPGEADPQEAQVSPCRPPFVLATRAARYS